MKLHLATSGGLANLRIEGQVDTSDLPPELAERVEAALTPERLREAAEAESSPFMMDAQQYELSVLPDSVLPDGGEGEVKRYHLDDSALSDEMLEVLDELRAEIARRRKSE